MSTDEFKYLSETSIDRSSTFLSSEFTNQPATPLTTVSPTLVRRPSRVTKAPLSPKNQVGSEHASRTSLRASAPMLTSALENSNDTLRLGAMRVIVVMVAVCVSIRRYCVVSAHRTRSMFVRVELTRPSPSLCSMTEFSCHSDQQLVVNERETVGPRYRRSESAQMTGQRMNECGCSLSLARELSRKGN